MFNLNLNKTMKDIQWSFISLVTASFSHLILRIVLSRDLGPSGLGLYTLVFTIYMFGMQFAAFGIGAAMTKYIAQYYDEKAKIRDFITAGIIGSLISGFLMGLLLYLLSNIIAIHFFHNSDMTYLLKITAFCFPFIAMQKVVIGTLNGMRKMKWYAIINIVQNISVVIISIILAIWLNMGLIGAVTGFVVPTIIIGLLSLSFIRNYLNLHSIKLHSTLKEIAGFGFYVVLASSIGLINTQTDSLLIGHLLDETKVGYYAVAVILMQAITLLPQAVQRVITPSIATYYGKKDFDNIRKLIKKTVLKSLIFTAFISVFLALSGKILIKLVFTEEFLPAYTPMLVLLIGYSIYAAFIPIGGCLGSIGKVKILYRITIIGAISNIFLNMILIPQFGLIGAASATSTSLIIIRITSLYFIIKYTKKI